MQLTPEQGKFLVKFARRTIESQFGSEPPEIPDDMQNLMDEFCGIFVTLQKYPGNDLRGCIGYTEPITPLGNAIMDVSLSSAFRDPRFRPVKKAEMKNLVVEISVLTMPELIDVSNPREYPEKITIGKDGLIVESGSLKGLLLPQVPVEWKWDVEEFLSHTCMKAGLTPDCWLDKNTKIYKFSAQIFSEIEPDGEVVEKLFV